MNARVKTSLPLLYICIISFFLFFKIVLFRFETTGDISFWRVLLLEFPIWMLVPVLIIYFKRAINIVAIALYNLILSSFFIAVVWYERYFQTLPSYFDLKQSDQAGSVIETVSLLAKPIDFLFFFDVIVYLVVLLIYQKAQISSVNRIVAGAIFTSFLLIGLLTLWMAFQKNMTDVTLFVKENGFLQTQLVQVYLTNNKGLASEVPLSALEIEELKGNEFVSYRIQERFGMAEDRHLFIIQVESMQEFVINEKVEGQEITPNINKLLEDSVNFDNIFQQIGAGNTSDSEWLIHTSLYPKGMEATVNYVDGEPIPSLVSMLNSDGYHTSTYHADKIEYWNRDKLYPTLGFDKYYSLSEIPEDDIIGIGPSDKVMFEFAEKQIERQLQNGEKIYANLITLTSHTPFIIPVSKQLLDLPEEFGWSYTGNYLQSIRYTDEQIGKFVDFLKEQGIYDDSMIVITGDHSGLHGTPMTKDDVKLVNKVIGHPYTIKDRFLLPFIITVPGLFKEETVSNFGGQIDIMPTILNLLGLVPDMPIVGHNILQYENNLMTMRYYLSGGSFMTGEHIYLGENARFPERYYDYSNMKKIEPDHEDIAQRSKNINKILEYSDSLLDRYLSQTETE